MQKKLMMIVILLLALSNRMAADDQLSISNFSIFTDSTASVSIALTNENDYAAFQFDLELPEGVTIKQNETGAYEYSANSDRITTSSELSMQQQSDGTYRFVFLSQSATALSGSSGDAIINLTLQTTATVEVGVKIGYFKNIKLSKVDGSGPTYTSQSFTFAVRGNEPYAVLNDDNTVLTFYYDKKKDVREGMELSNSSWSDNRQTITSVVFDSSFANYSDLTTTSSWFTECSNLTAITGLEYLNTENVTNMGLMFDGCSSLTAIDVSHFNTAKVTNMRQLFRNCSSLTNLDVSNFNTDQVENMHSMFNGCSSLTELNVSRFNTEKVTDIASMFYGCSSLTSLDVSNFSVSNITELNSMFNGCERLTNIDISGFNTSTVTNMAYMFSYCNALKTIYVGEGWSTDAVTSSDNMFADCDNLVGGKGTAYDSQYKDATYARIDGGPNSETPGYLTYINTPASYNINVSVSGNGKLTVDNTDVDSNNSQNVSVDRGAAFTLTITPDTGYKLDNIKLDDVDVTEQVDTAATTGIMTFTISGVYGEHSIVASFVNDTPEPYAVLSDENTKLTFYYDNNRDSQDGMDVSTIAWQSYKEYITTVVFDESFADYTSLTSTANWFFNCDNLSTITGIGNLKTDNVTDMTGMFQYCSSLTSLDLSSWNTANVENMTNLFYDCQNLETITFSSLFNTAKVTGMGSMFYNCKKLTSLDLSSFNTEKVTLMEEMFYGCAALTELDLSTFNTALVTEMNDMFMDATSLKTIYVGDNWVAPQSSTRMFNNCTSIVGGSGTVYDEDYTGSGYAHIDGGTSNPGYLTDIADKGKEDEAYAVLSEENTKLTFYYDKKKDTRGGFDYNMLGSQVNSELITSVVFDDSFAANTSLTSTANWFYGMSNLVTIEGLGNLKTDNVSEMNAMFSGCSKLTSIDVSNFNTTNVTDMTGMFYGCEGLTELNLSSFNTSNVTGMGFMFYSCSALTTIYVGAGWSTENVGEGETLFGSCDNLVGGKGSTPSNVSGSNGGDVIYAHIDGGTSNPGFFTDIEEKGKEPYAILSDENTKLTFYYDKNKTTNNGLDISGELGWDSNRITITSVVFDESFANCNTITSTAHWFEDMAALTSLVGLNNLNTANVTDMSKMFSGAAITSFDLGDLNTDRVTNMSEMFSGCSSLTSVKASGFKADKLTNMSAMFYGCSSLTSLDFSDFKVDNVTDMSAMFSWCSSLTSLDLSGFNTSNVTDMSNMFDNCMALTSLDLSGFNTEKVISMRMMFEYCRGLKTLNVSGFNTANVTDMGWMFNECTDLTDLDLSSFNTGNVTSMMMMFANCSSLTSLDVSGFNTDKVTEMGGLFSGCTNLTSIDVSNFNTANVTGMGGMFSGYRGQSLDLGNFKTSTVTDMQNMFYSCINLSTIYVGDGWNTDKVTSGNEMFDGCTNLIGGSGTTYDADHKDYTYAHIDGGTDNPGYFTDIADKDQVDEPYAVLTDNDDEITTDEGTVKGKTLTFYYDKLKETRNGISVGPFDYSNCTEWKNQRGENVNKVVFDASFSDCTTLTSTAYWFAECDKLEEIVGIANLKTDNVQNMDRMFLSCSSLSELDVSNFNTENVIYMQGLFAGCSKLEYLDVSHFNTANVTDMDNMFEGCSSLTSIDVSNFVTDNVTSMLGMFLGCYELKSLDVSKFNTSNVKSMAYMFSSCRGLETIDVSNFITTHNRFFNYMFSNCSGLKSLDLSSFGTTGAESMSGMFNSCNSLTTIYVGDGWSTEGIETEQTMFEGCTSLVGGLGTTFNSDHTDYTYAHIDGGTDNPGYLTDKYGVILTVKDYSREYGAANPTFEYTAKGVAISGTPTITCEATDTTSVGTYPITITYTSSDSERDLNVTSISGTLTITKAPLTITAKSYSIQRGKTLPTYEVDYSGFKNRETSAVLTKKPTITCEAKADTVAGTYQIIASDAEAKNYEIKYVAGSLTITDDVVVTAKSYSRVYGEANPTFEYTSDGATLSGTPSITCDATATSPVGTYDIVIAKGDVTNSEVTYVKGTLIITKAPLTITAKSYTIKRGGTLPTFEVEYSGFKNNETDTVFTTKPTITCEAKADTVAGTYPIVVSGAEAKNYEIEYVDGSLTITDDVVVTAKSYSRVYGDANPTFEFTSEGATLSGKPSITCDATATSPVGTYDIVIAKGDVTNSEVTYVKGTLIITKAPLTITAKSYSVKQGKDLPTFELEYSGFKNNETDTVFTKKPTASTTATKYSNVGTYDIVITEAEANNYEMKYVNGTLTITAKTESFDGNVLTVDDGGNIEDALENIGGRDEAAKTIAAIVWNSKAALTSDMLKGFDNPNMLIYVASKDQAPEGRDNVIVDGVASYVKLTDSDTGNNNFYAPKEFTADSIVYTREFKQKTRKNVSRGWESICLPFTVQTFTHESHGQIAPFGSTASTYHFWLHQFTDKGIVDAETLEANKPYLISMPNSDEYYEEFNQAGLIKFASAKVKVPVTETNTIMIGDSVQIIPTFQTQDASDYAYALNVGDSILTNPEGSIFVSNYRKVRPFEVYTFHEPNHRDRSGSRIIMLSSLYGGNGTTGIDDVTVDPTLDVWYDLSGRRLQSKPSKGGLYIHNGRKVVIK